jgi:hypothetical protein
MAVIESYDRNEYVFVAIETFVVSVDGKTSADTKEDVILGINYILKVDPGTHLIRVVRRRWGIFERPYRKILRIHAGDQSGAQLRVQEHVSAANAHGDRGQGSTCRRASGQA